MKNEFKVGDVVRIPPDFIRRGEIKVIFPYTGRALVKMDIYYHLIPLSELKPV